MDTDNLMTAALQRRRVDACRLQDFVNFMYIDDLAYKQLPTEVRGVDPASFDLPLWPRPTVRQATDVLERWRPEEGVELLAMAALVEQFGDVMLVDVGCQYGSSAMHLAQKGMHLAIARPVEAFDCGVAGELAHINFINNGFAEHVRFHPFAVGSVDRYVLMHAHVGNSEDNRIVNAVAQRTVLDLSEPVRCVSLDKFLGEPANFPPLFAKIDTQGNEPRVFQGLGKWIATRRTAFVLEFTPWAMASTQDPVEFAQLLAQTHLLFDLPPDNGTGRFRQIDAGDVTDLVRRTDATPAKWTDLLAIDRTLGSADRVASILARHAG
jgi:FkbM family methyltransferase